jgi:hypothetical protein
VRVFFASGGSRAALVRKLTQAQEQIELRKLRADAVKTRWLWTLPVEAGYARSLIEVQAEWSLDDVLLVADRVREKNKAIEQARREAARR